MRICTIITLALTLALIPLMGLAAGTATGQTKTNQVDGAAMVFVPAGEFIMGANDGDADEQPQLNCYVDGYWIYKFEVTVAQYRQFCQVTGKAMPDEPSWGWHDDLPMTGIGWKDANDYAKWAGGRLPTEAEWEKAARGTDGRLYPWGSDDIADRYTGLDKTRKGPDPVGSHPDGASPYGCQDMAGNAAEWCLDWYDPDYYQLSLAYNPSGPLEGTSRSRVSRGGSWSSANSRSARCIDRSKLTYNCRYFNVGFRVVVGGRQFAYQENPPQSGTRTTTARIPVIRQPRTTTTTRTPAPTRRTDPEPALIRTKLPGTDNYLTGRVTFGGLPVAGAVVCCLDAQGCGQKKDNVTADAQGRFKMGPLPDRDVMAYVAVRDNPKYFNAHAAVVTLKGGESVEIPPIKLLRVIDPISPKEGSTVSPANGGVKLVWSAVEMADDYRVTIREKQGMKIVAQARSQTPEAVIPAGSLVRGVEYLVTLSAGSRDEPRLGATAGCGRAPWTFTLN